MYDFIKLKIYNIFGRIGSILFQPNDISNLIKNISSYNSAVYALNNMQSAIPFKSDLKVHNFSISRASKDGLVLEFGVYSGRTINFISTFFEKVYGFDSFEGLPEDWRPNVLKGHFARNDLPRINKNVELVVGWFNKSLPEFVKNLPNDAKISYLHIDCDLYSSTKEVFNFLTPYIKSGTIIVFDEYFNYPNWEKGEFLAFKEFCQENKVTYEYIAYNTKHEQVAVKILNISK
jgi:hypothetical protein